MNKSPEKIVNWLKEYSLKNNRKCFVVGVSGGVDSALVSTLCAMTGIKTIVVFLACDSKSSDYERFVMHSEWLSKKFTNVVMTRIELTDVFNFLKKEIPPIFDSEIGWANTKSRLRMVTLYQIATSMNGLVVGTGNKVEDFGIGFFTKYGDGGVDISPIGDLTKTEVRQMCKKLNISPKICNAIPSDGLWDDNRTDEEQIGATYEELEWAMNPSEHPTFEQLTDRQIKILKIYEQRRSSNYHKFIPIPVFNSW